MLLGFGYLYVCYAIFLFSSKSRKQQIKKNSWLTFCNIICLFLLKVGSIGPVDQQVNYILT